MVRGAGECRHSVQHSLAPDQRTLRLIPVPLCYFADEASLEQLVVKHQGDKWSTAGQGQTLGGADVATSNLSEREKRLAALEKRGL